LSYQAQANENAGFRPLDLATLIYIAFQLCIFAVYGRLKPGPFLFLDYYLTRLGVFTFYIAAAIVVIIFTLVKPDGILKIFRLTYPLFMVTFLYEALKSQVFLIHNHPFDSVIVSIENAILGFDSSFVLQRFMEFWLNEVMNFFYISYYFLLPLTAIMLALKRSWISLEKLTLAAAVTFFVSYGIFVILPVVGPRIYLENIYYLPLDGPFFTPLAQQVVHSGGLQGGAMPSSHCAVALVAVWFIIKEFHFLKLPAYIVLIMLCASTVYGRYHYISDVVVGLTLGAICIWATSKWQAWYIKALESKKRTPELEPVEMTVEG
jgi:membrane-associated phospholipid phosphatase